MLQQADLDGLEGLDAGHYFAGLGLLGWIMLLFLLVAMASSGFGMLRGRSLKKWAGASIAFCLLAILAGAASSYVGYLHVVAIMQSSNVEPTPEELLEACNQLYFPLVVPIFGTACMLLFLGGAAVIDRLTADRGDPR